MAATTRAQALRALRVAFAEAGLDDAALDARLLVIEATGADAAALIADGDRPLGAEAASRLAEYARMRLARVPIARILGRAEFWGLPFALSPETLVPRPDTETLVEAVLALAPERPARVLDLGTGSGCILVALLYERPHWTGIGIDRSEGAARVARANAETNGVGARMSVFVGDWAAALAPGARFDVVVSNPPYIPGADIPGLAPEVRTHDPARALDGGVDGLDAYRLICADAPDRMADGGLLALEIGIGQAADVAALGEAAGLTHVRTARDLAGIERVVAFLNRP